MFSVNYGYFHSGCILLINTHNTMIFHKILVGILDDITSPSKNDRNIESQQNFEDNHFSISTVPADSLALLGVRISAGTVMNSFGVS